MYYKIRVPLFLLYHKKMTEKIYSKYSYHIYIYEIISYDTVKNVSIALDKIQTDIINKNSNKKFILRKKPIIFHIHSPGGSLEAGLQLFNIIQHLNENYHTYSINEGLCASAATLPFLACKTRVVSPFSVFLIHQYSSQLKGKHQELENDVKFGKEIMEILKNIYKKYTKGKSEDISRLLFRDKYLSPTYMKKIGMADYILEIPSKSKIKNNKSNTAKIKEQKYPNFILMDRYISIPEKMDDNTDKFKIILPFIKILHFISINSKEIGPTRIYLENISDNIIGFTNFLPILNAIIFQKNNVEVLSNGYLENFMAILFIVAPNSIFNQNEIIKINLQTVIDAHKIQYIDIKENTKLMRELITNLLKKRTNMKEKDIKSLFSNTFIFSSKMAKMNKLIF